MMVVVAINDGAKVNLACLSVWLRLVCLLEGEVWHMSRWMSD